MAAPSYGPRFGISRAPFGTGSPTVKTANSAELALQMCNLLETKGIGVHEAIGRIMFHPNTCARKGGNRLCLRQKFHKCYRLIQHTRLSPLSRGSESTMIRCH